MNRSFLIMIGSLVVLGGLLMLLANKDAPRQQAGNQPIFLFCAASNRAVMEAIRAEYEREFQRQVQIQYGPSMTLFTSIDVSSAGDLFLPADDSFLEMAREQGLLAEQLPIARMQGVVAVRRDNPKSIHTFADLLRDDVRFIQASDAAAIGAMTRKVLTTSGQWDQLDQATIAYRTTVTDVANDIVVGAADAGIVFDAVLHTYPTLKYIEIPELEPVQARISVGVIASTRQPQAALHFARYLSARDRGLKHYAEHGFRVAEGDRWEDVPELSVFAGSMLRPAIDKTLVEFEEREGVRINRVYNGCGILVAQMKAGQLPDAYFACDSEFMAQVSELFPLPVPVTQNELVILVAKGNPHGIRELHDLTREGLRVGIGHEKQCAMGWLTQNVLRETGLQAEVMANVTVQSPTGDMLVNQLQTGALDAAVAYLTNAAGAGEFLDAVRIQNLPCAVATQPWAVASRSDFSQTTDRLFQRLLSAESQDRFAAEGFRWQAEAARAGDHDD